MKSIICTEYSMFFNGIWIEFLCMSVLIRHGVISSDSSDKKSYE